MTTIRDSAILAARSAHEAVMDSTVVIWRKSTISDDQGGTEDAYIADTVGVNCTFARYPVRPLERERDPFVQVIDMWIFRFPVGTVIHSTDRIVELASSRQFEVVSAGSGTVEITKQAICLEIT